MKSQSEEFIQQLDYAKHGISFCGHTTDILQLVWSIKYQVKEFFPMNGVPESIVKSLDSLTEKFKDAEKELSVAVDQIIQEVKKLDGLE